VAISLSFYRITYSPPSRCSQLYERLSKQWTPESLRVLVRSVFTKSAAQLRLLRRRRKNGFGDYHAWIRMLDLLLLFAKKCQQRSSLKLTPLVVYLHKLNPMGVTVHQLTPMSVSVHQLTPMGVILLKLTPMGVILLKLTPMGVILHHILSTFLTMMKKRKNKFR
jgi:hypothetical protein